MLRHTKTNDNKRGWLIEFEVPITKGNFREACQTAIELAKIECATQNAVAINFVAMGVDVQVTEADTVETQHSLWERRADAYNAIRNELAKSWDPIHLDAKGSPLTEAVRSMKNFTWGKVLNVFNYDLDGPTIEIVKFHPWVRGENGTVRTGEPDLGEIQFHCEELSESFHNIQSLLIAWIARKNIGNNQHHLVEGISRALCIK